MGFNKAANPDVVATLKAAVDKINGLPVVPEFMLHTGDISHLSKPEEFDTVDQVLRGAKPKDVFFVPGEHDVLNDDGKQYLDRYGKGTKGAGWYSFDQERSPLHRAGQRFELESRRTWHAWPGTTRLAEIGCPVICKHSTPIVVFAHIPFGPFTRNGDGEPKTAHRPSDY